MYPNMWKEFRQEMIVETMANYEANGSVIGVDCDEVQQEKSQRKIAKYDSGAADLEKVTDYAEEKEIFSADLSGVSNT